MNFFIVLLLALIRLTSGQDLEAEPKQKVPQLRPRITNGIPASEGQFSYEVGLHIRKRDHIVFCGGSLISPTWIITSAACVDGAKQVYAFLGSTKIQSGSLVSARQSIIHRDFNPKTLANDIALVHIPAVILGKGISAVKLPPLSNSPESYVDEEVIAVGWGITDDNGSRPVDLQYAISMVAENDLCINTFAGPFDFTESNLCVVGKMGTSSCRGDSGHSLVLLSSGVLIGINSYSASKCTLGYPEGYTRVSSYRAWINDVTEI